MNNNAESVSYADQLPDPPRKGFRLYAYAISWISLADEDIPVCRQFLSAQHGSPA